jgi:hypothetical protein
MIVGLSSDGHPVSATADFTAVGDLVTVKLTNTTATTLDAGELFTGLDFSISGLTPVLGSRTAKLRTIFADGTSSTTPTALSLSWSLANLGGGMWQLNSNPNTEHGIVGPPTAGTYAGADGSIKGNAGNNPFAAEMAVFKLNVPGFSLAPFPSVVVKAFRFGTNLAPATGVITRPGTGVESPEPATVTLLLLAAAGATLAVGQRRR